jgi:signal transduction histidine kinase
VPRVRPAGGAGRTEPPGAALAGSSAELLEFAVGQVLREDSAVGALPVLLARLASLFGCRAALAFQEDTDGGLVVLAAFPQQAGTKEELRAAITRLTAAHRAETAEHGYFQATLVPGPRPAGTGVSLLMASSPETGGRRLCSIAPVGDASQWDASCRATTRALAAIVAAQIRHTNDTTGRHDLAEQRERLLEAEFAAREAAERTQQRLTEQNAQLQELDEAKTEFLATVSHELRTPLTSIISFTELILDDPSQLPADTVDALSVIQRNGDKLLRLLGDLLLLSRLEVRAIALDLGSVAVPGLIREAVRSASATAAERGIEVTASTQDGPLLKADLLRLQQIMDNLLSNAIKFSGRGGKVQVSARPEGQMWRIDVTDEGIGIPADELVTLFGRFVRGTNARMAGLPGAGLGLSVVKAIAELHSGRVEVESTVELGSTFSVFLPVLDQPVTP